MITACVIDASVAIKGVIIEAGTEAARRLGEDEIAFHALDLTVPETGNILWKKIQRGELTQAEAEVACGILRLAKIELHAMQPQALLALQTATPLDHPVYDTTCPALAGALGMPFITADRGLVNKVAATGVPSLPEFMLLA